MRRGALLVVAVVLGLALGCSDMDESAPQKDAASEESTDSAGSTTEAIDPDVLAARILTVQSRVLGFADRAGQWQDLPKPVKQAYNRLDRVMSNGAVAPREYEAATRNLRVLQEAVSSGQLQKVVVREKAKRRRQERDSSGGGSDCMGGYSPCLPVTGDLDCADVVAMGRAPVRVRGSDPYGLDGDNDGIGCE
jgi:hypothetical protein